MFTGTGRWGGLLPVRVRERLPGTATAGCVSHPIPEPTRHTCTCIRFYMHRIPISCPSKALASVHSWLLQWAWLHRCAAPTACSGHAVSCLSGRSGWIIRRQYMRINHGSHLYFCCNFSPGAWRAGVRALVLGFPGSMTGTATGCGVGAPAQVAAMDTMSLCNTSESLESKQL